MTYSSDAKIYYDDTMKRHPEAMEAQTFKADDGKYKPELLFAGVPKALIMVAWVLTYGAQKYEAHSWKRVAMERYHNAFGRHFLERHAGEERDDESDLTHLAHEACNALFVLQDYLDKHPEEMNVVLKNPPTDHKGDTYA